MSVLHPRPKTGAAEFDRARVGIGLPRTLGAQLHGKGVRRKDIRALGCHGWVTILRVCTYIFEVLTKEKGIFSMYVEQRRRRCAFWGNMLSSAVGAARRSLWLLWRQIIATDNASFYSRTAAILTSCVQRI